MKQKPILKVVKPSARAANGPPRALGAAGMALWQRITAEYDVSDVAGKELLALACAALDRCEALREAIDHDGEFSVSRTGVMREHPGIKPELAGRAFVAKMLLRLGLDVEPVRPVGRPPKQSGQHSWLQQPRDEE